MQNSEARSSIVTPSPRQIAALITCHIIRTLPTPWTNARPSTWHDARSGKTCVRVSVSRTNERTNERKDDARVTWYGGAKMLGVFQRQTVRISDAFAKVRESEIEWQRTGDDGAHQIYANIIIHKYLICVCSREFSNTVYASARALDVHMNECFPVHACFVRSSSRENIIIYWYILRIIRGTCIFVYIYIYVYSIESARESSSSCVCNWIIVCKIARAE